MEEDTECMKLPVEERCVHKSWKARISGYEELTTRFRQIDDEKSPEFSKYLGLVKKFVVDNNAMAQEKGLEAVLAYVECYALAGKTVGDVMSGIVTKCLAAPKAKTKELAVQVTLMYIEIEKQDAVQEELLKGLEAKNPKLVSSCVSTYTQALREFGIKVINVKPLIKKIPALLEDRDKVVRDEGKAMVIEVHKWIGNALKPQLNTLKPVQMTELEAEFEKASKQKAVPTRYLRSEQQKQAAVAAAAADGDGDEDEDVDEADGSPEVDAYDIMDPVDILSKLAKDFYEKVEAKKWQERKEAVDALEQLVQAPKLETGDYGDLVRALKKIITKDSNVMVIATAGKCLAGLANGLKKRFQPYAGACIPAILEKFREKKQNVVLALREAIDAIFISTNIEAIQEDALAALENKNPSVKAECASFLSRCFTRCTPVMLNKKLLKAYTTALLKTLNEPDPTVRDSAAEALGAAMKAAGEKAIMPFLNEVDNMKLTKIKECCDKTVMVVKVPKEKPVATKNVKNDPPKTNASAAGKPVARKPASASKKPVVKKPAASENTDDKKGSGKSRELNMDEIEERAIEMLSADVVSGLGDSNWKVRLSAVEQIIQKANGMELKSEDSQVLIGILNKKPGLRDTNVQVAKARIEAVKCVAESTSIPSFVLESCIADIADKLGDVKNSQLASNTLLSLAEASKLSLVSTEVLNFAFTQKNPKVQQEALNWVGTAILDFGLQVQAKVLMENIKKALNATNPIIRNSAINLIGILYIYLGDDLRMFFENEKPSLLQLINAEFEKQYGITPPSPTRGMRSTDENEEQQETANNEVENINLRELMPRVDISSQITDAILTDLSDKNWQVRNEALQKMSAILSKDKFITSNLGELPPILAKRLVDSNGKIAAAAIAIVEQLGTAMGSQGKPHVRTFFPGMLQGMGDSKPWVRAAAMHCINTWGEQCGYKEFFDGEMIADALKTGSPALRTELWAWLAEKLPTVQVKSIPKDELLSCIPYLYSNFEDRNVDVRKNAQEAALAYMMHLGYESMLRSSEKLTPASQNTVRIVLDKVYPNLPSKPAPKKKDATGNNEDAEQNRGLKTSASKSNLAKGSAKKPGAAKPTGRKKDDDSDFSPLLQTNNLKNQRVIDEHKLKVLKWNFTTPREEFVELLRDQMTTANVNKNLISNMFHSDFKFHLKAIDALSEDLPNNPSATVANLDLVLKWMTLRFFDTNPSVLIKGLEYLQAVFDCLIREEYNMSENEASSFIPYLILKCGDPKDAVRNSVRVLFKQIRNMYPASKLFVYVMDGLKSKNARQRTECLDILGSLIENYGMFVCQPSPGAAMKEVARQISDRDNSVRNAALNCIVQAYFLEGDKVYKMIGQISDKDLSLLEERIKRASKNRPVSKSVPPPVNRQAPQSMPKLIRQGSDSAIPKESMKQDEPEPPPVMSNDRSAEPHSQDEAVDYRRVFRSSPPKPRPVSGPYGLDITLLERIEGKGVNICAPKLHEFDFGEILGCSPIEMPGADAVPAAIPTSAAKVPISRVSPMVSPQRPHSAINNRSVMEEGIGIRPVGLSLETAISYLASTDHTRFKAAANQIDHLLQSQNRMLMSEHCDQFIIVIVIQLRILSDSCESSSNVEEISAGFRLCFMLLLTFFYCEDLTKKVSRDVLRDLIQQLLNLLVEKKMETLPSCDQYIKVVNLVVVKIIEKSDPTNVVCVLIRMLHDSLRVFGISPTNRFTDLVMKCIWKVIRLLPKWDEQLDYDSIFLDIHLFFKEFPSSMWKKVKGPEGDTPLRTVKTMLHTITKSKGVRILNHLSKISNRNESELATYLEKLIRCSSKQDTVKKQKADVALKKRRLSKSTQDLLSEIFSKIGSKEETKDGLKLLYDFREKHPEADIEPFLQKSSQFFQEYIQKGLQNIEDERKRSNIQPSMTATTSMSSLGVLDSCNTLTPSSDTDDVNLEKSDDMKSQRMKVLDTGEELDPGVKNPEYFLERLRCLQKDAGIDQTPDAIVRKQNAVATDMNLPIRRRVFENREVPAAPRPMSTTGADIDELRKRLAAIKTQPT